MEGAFLENGITLFRLPLSSLAGLAVPRRFLALRRMVKSFHPDLLHAHLYHAEVVSCVASLFTAVPLLATRHSAGLEFEGKKRWAVRLMRGSFDSLIAVSAEAASEAVEMGYDEKRVFTVPNGIDTRRFHPLEELERIRQKRMLIERLFPSGGDGSSLLIGSLGGLKAVKNFPLLIRIAARLVKEWPETEPGLKFVVFGEGNQRAKLTRLARDLDIGSHLVMPGYCDRPEEVYPLLDIFVLPSLAEGVPMAVLEAMASGTVCVASSVGGVSELIGDTGKLVEPGDEDGFRVAVATLLASEQQRRELGRRARVRVMERYDIDIWGSRMLQVYRSVLDKNH